MGRVICDSCGEINDYGYVKCQKCGSKLNYKENYIIEDSKKIEKINDFDEFYVNISAEEAEKLLEKSNIGASCYIKGKSSICFSTEKSCTVFMLEKYFSRVKSYVAGTVIIDNADNKTRVQVLTAGGGTGLLGFEFGSEDSFRTQIEDIFSEYIVD